MAQLPQVQTGTQIVDANEVNLLNGATLNAAGTTNGTVVQVDRPGDVAFQFEAATVTGTTPTARVTIQGSDDITFATGVVDYASVGPQLGAAGAQSNTVKTATAYAYKKYARAVVTLGGTSPVYTGSKLTVRPPHTKRTTGTTAS
jgi:hypothetical protein